MKTTTDQIYLSRNRHKNRYQTYTYEALMNVMQKQAKKILGKESFSLFNFAASCIILGKLGLKFEFLNKEDISNIKKLHIRITTNG